jgi:hypothetical protein
LKDPRSFRRKHDCSPGPHPEIRASGFARTIKKVLKQKKKASARGTLMTFISLVYTRPKLLQCVSCDQHGSIQCASRSGLHQSRDTCDMARWRHGEMARWRHGDKARWRHGGDKARASLAEVHPGGQRGAHRHRCIEFDKPGECVIADV